eukprot:PhM_4_TR10056/c11_g1_i1/m.42473
MTHPASLYDEHGICLSVYDIGDNVEVYCRGGVYEPATVEDVRYRPGTENSKRPEFVFDVVLMEGSPTNDGDGDDLGVVRRTGLTISDLRRPRVLSQPMSYMGPPTPQQHNLNMSVVAPAPLSGEVFMSEPSASPATQQHEQDGLEEEKEDGEDAELFSIHSGDEVMGEAQPNATSLKNVVVDDISNNDFNILDATSSSIGAGDMPPRFFSSARPLTAITHGELTQEPSSRDHSRSFVNVTPAATPVPPAAAAPDAARMLNLSVGSDVVKQQQRPPPVIAEERVAGPWGVEQNTSNISTVSEQRGVGATSLAPRPVHLQGTMGVEASRPQRRSELHEPQSLEQQQQRTSVSRPLSSPTMHQPQQMTTSTTTTSCSTLRKPPQLSPMPLHTHRSAVSTRLYQPSPSPSPSPHDQSTQTPSSDQKYAATQQQQHQQQQHEHHSAIELNRRVSPEHHVSPLSGRRTLSPPGSPQRQHQHQTQQQQYVSHSDDDVENDDVVLLKRELEQARIERDEALLEAHKANVTADVLRQELDAARAQVVALEVKMSKMVSTTAAVTTTPRSRGNSNVNTKSPIRQALRSSSQALRGRQQQQQQQNISDDVADGDGDADDGGSFVLEDVAVPHYLSPAQPSTFLSSNSGGSRRVQQHQREEAAPRVRRALDERDQALRMVAMLQKELDHKTAKTVRGGEQTSHPRAQVSSSNSAAAAATSIARFMTPTYASSLARHQTSRKAAAVAARMK